MLSVAKIVSSVSVDGVLTSGRAKLLSHAWCSIASSASVCTSHRTHNPVTVIAIPNKVWFIHLHKDIIWSKYDAGGGSDDNNDDGTNNNNNNSNNNNKEMGVKLDNEHWYNHVPKSAETSH